MFERAVSKLEFDKIRFILAECTSFQGAKERIASLLPATNVGEVRFSLSQTTAAKQMIAIKGGLHISTVPTVPEEARRAAKGMVLTCKQLLQVGDLLSDTRQGVEYADKLDLDNPLFSLFSRLIPHKALEDNIRRAIIGEETLADDASEELYKIRKRIRLANGKIRETLQQMITSAKLATALQDSIVTQRNGRYVIPVKIEHKNEVRGLVHDTSSSGATVFIEPLAVLELNNEIRMLENQEKQEIQRVLSDFSDNVGINAETIAMNYENLCDLAVIFAKAELSYSMKGIEPFISDDMKMDLRNARHPLLAKEKVVPISVKLGYTYTSLVVTGPNTGGKTVSLKTCGLLSMMAQAGMHIPASEGSVCAVFSDILADIGDEQSIEQSLSTFSSHMIHIIDIMNRARHGTLVIFDELGAGTDPVEGAALAIAILEHVRHKGAFCLATTHYAELKSFAMDTPGVENASCEFDVESLRPTYRLLVGTPGRSNAFLIAERLGLPAEVANAAKALIREDQQEFARMIEKLEQSRTEMEKAKAEADKIRDETKTAHEKALQEKETLLESAKRDVENARMQAQRIIRGAEAVSESVFKELEILRRKREDALRREELEKSRAAFRATLKQAEGNVVVASSLPAEPQAPYVLPRPLQVGDRVLVVSFKVEGIIEQMDGGQYSVIAGSMRLKAKEKDLRLLEAKKEAGKKAAGGLRTMVSARSEIDLRGETGDDAWFRVDKYLDEANMAGLHSVTLIHGKGTGALRKALWDMLKRDNRVESFRTGAYGEGDFGVTVVELK